MCGLQVAICTTAWTSYYGAMAALFRMVDEETVGQCDDLWVWNCCAPAVQCNASQHIGQKRRRRTITKKRLHDQPQNRTNTPGYIARTWAHYTIMIEGPPMSTILYRVGKCTQTNPNQTPTRPELCHNCASRWHLDLMHNITPPIKERLSSNVERMVNESSRK